jgi:MFS family permease
MRDNVNEQLKKPLWTKDFTIITLGSVVSMFGNSLSGFAMSLFVLDYTKSIIYYALFLFFYNLPKLVMPIVSGPILDRFSRKKAIYTLDFLSSGLYLVMAIILCTGYFNFVFLAAACFLIGAIDSTYNVAYDSFYPLLISEGNYSKAYSVASTLNTLSAFMVPLAVGVYKQMGIVPIFAVNAVSFLIAAIMETRIKAEEKYIDERDNENPVQGTEQAKYVENSTAGYIAAKVEKGRFRRDLKEGIAYILNEKGLLAIVVYFTFAAFAGGASDVITLPYFKDNYTDGVSIYMQVWVMAMIGRIIGGNMHYRIKLPEKKKYTIALVVYVVIALFGGSYLYFDIGTMQIMCFLTGVLGVTSYNIRISATQKYVPDIKKGRFNGIFSMLSTSGMLLGQLLSGALTVHIPGRIVLAIFMLIQVIAAVVVVGGNKKQVSVIYNIQA